MSETIATAITLIAVGQLLWVMKEIGTIKQVIKELTNSCPLFNQEVKTYGRKKKCV